MARRRSQREEAQSDLQNWWDHFFAALDRRAWEETAVLLGAFPRTRGIRPGEILYAQAIEVWERDGVDKAHSLLQQAVARQPSHADARHGLALCHEQAGEHEEMVAQFLAVLRLDTAQQQRHDLLREGERRLLFKLAEEVLDGLPRQWRHRLENVPVVLEARPSMDLVREGFDPRALGLFEGNPAGAADMVALAPTRIVLFAANLLAATRDDESLAEQVEITILHEIGHFFGLDEDEVARLGLA